MKTDNTTRILKVIDSIGERLDNLEELMSFLVRSDQRFKKGQRVKFSAKAYRAGIAPAKGGVTRGKVIEAGNSFSVKVLLDGYKRPHSYHHAFFDQPSTRR